MFKSVRFLLLLLAVFPLTCCLAWADDPPPPPLEPVGYSQLWADKTAVVTPEAIMAAVAGIKKQQDDPQDIVLFIHGFDVARDSSTAEFNSLVGRLDTEFDKTKVRVAYVGLQWESAADTSIFNMDAAYFAKISVARSVGRGPARQLFLAIQDAFPKAHLSVMAHSMGCEVLAAAAVPEMVYKDQVPFVETFQADKDVKLDLAVLCGSDLDYDIWSKGEVIARTNGDRVRLMWQTVAPYLGKGDKVLNLRSHIRGKAGGAAFPKMTLEQLDNVCSNHRISFDGEDIPNSHAFRLYYDQERLARIVPTLLYLDNPKLPKPAELAEVEQILNAPPDIDMLLPFLNSVHYGTLFYTLWRIERLNCGDARHLADGTLETVGRLLKDKPQMIWRQQAKSKCITIQKGQFPTEKMMTRAGAPPSARRN